MLLTFREWWQSLWCYGRIDDIPPLPTPKRYRATMGRCVCPRCQRQIAYSSTTQLTARHLCQGERRQWTIGPHAVEVSDEP